MKQIPTLSTGDQLQQELPNPDYPATNAFVLRMVSSERSARTAELDSIRARIDNISADAYADVTDELRGHTTNSGIHVSESDRSSWSNAAAVSSALRRDVDGHLSSDMHITEADRAVIAGKQDAIPGKTLTSNDFTDEMRDKLAGIDMSTKVDVAPGKTLTSNDFTDGMRDKLAGIDMSTKVDVVPGKTLTSNDFTDEMRDKLDGIDMSSKADLVDGKVPAEQIPDRDPSVVVASADEFPAEGSPDVMYVDSGTRLSYVWDRGAYVPIDRASPPIIGTTAGTAYPGELGAMTRRDVDDLQNIHTESSHVSADDRRRWDGKPSAQDLAGYLPLTAGASSPVTGKLRVVSSGDDRSIEVVGTNPSVVVGPAESGVVISSGAEGSHVMIAGRELATQEYADTHGPVTSVAGRTGAVTVMASDLAGLDDAIAGVAGTVYDTGDRHWVVKDFPPDTTLSVYVHDHQNGRSDFVLKDGQVELARIEGAPSSSITLDFEIQDDPPLTPNVAGIHLVTAELLPVVRNKFGFVTYDDIAGLPDKKNFLTTTWPKSDDFYDAVADVVLDSVSDSVGAWTVYANGEVDPDTYVVAEAQSDGSRLWALYLGSGGVVSANEPYDPFAEVLTAEGTAYDESTGQPVAVQYRAVREVKKHNAHGIAMVADLPSAATTEAPGLVTVSDAVPQASGSSGATPSVPTVQATRSYVDARTYGKSVPVTDREEESGVAVVEKPVPVKKSYVQDFSIDYSVSMTADVYSEKVGDDNFICADVYVDGALAATGRVRFDPSTPGEYTLQYNNLERVAGSPWTLHLYGSFVSYVYERMDDGYMNEDDEWVHDYYDSRTIVITPADGELDRQSSIRGAYYYVYSYSEPTYSSIDGQDPASFRFNDVSVCDDAYTYDTEVSWSGGYEPYNKLTAKFVSRNEMMLTETYMSNYYLNWNDEYTDYTEVEEHDEVDIALLRFDDSTGKWTLVETKASKWNLGYTEMENGGYFQVPLHSVRVSDDGIVKVMIGDADGSADGDSATYTYDISGCSGEFSIANYSATARSDRPTYVLVDTSAREVHLDVSLDDPVEGTLPDYVMFIDAKTAKVDTISIAVPDGADMVGPGMPESLDQGKVLRVSLTNVSGDKWIVDHSEMERVVEDE